MPTEDEHFDQAEKNERLAQLLSTPGFTGETFHDWEVTTLFYSALHYIDAFLASKGIRAGGHPTRNDYVAKLEELRPIASKYINLHHRSDNARYQLFQFPGHEVTKLEKESFEPVKNLVCSLLGRP